MPLLRILDTVSLWIFGEWQAYPSISVAVVFIDAKHSCSPTCCCSFHGCQTFL